MIRAIRRLWKMAPSERATIDNASFHDCETRKIIAERNKVSAEINAMLRTGLVRDIPNMENCER